MKKYKILIGLICMFLLINSALADDIKLDLNKTLKFEISNISNKFATPVLIKVPNVCAFPDCRDIVLVDESGREYPQRFLDVNDDGIPEYLFLIPNLNLDILEQPYKIKFNDSPPKVTYENQTIVNDWKICYQKENVSICKWKDNKEDPDINFNVGIYLEDIRNRLDLYTIAKFNSNPSVNYFCPLVLDLDTWPQYMILLGDKEIKTETEMVIEYAPFRISNLEIYDKSFLDVKIYKNNDETHISTHKIYGGVLILMGSNKSFIITKPIGGQFNQSQDFFFKTEILLNGHIQASVCTTNHTSELLLTKGPNAYIVFDEPDTEKIVEMSLYLSNIPDPIINPPESIETQFFEGNVWPLYYSSPEIVPKIVFEQIENFFPFLTFTWITQNGEINKTVKNNNNEIIFEQPVLLNGNSWMYPIDKYEAIVYINPPVIRNANRSMSFISDDAHEGTAQFENNRILFQVERNRNSQTKYFIGLVISIIVFYYSNKHIKNLKKISFQPKNILQKIGLIFSPLIVYFVSISDSIIYSIGTLPFFFMIIWLLLAFILKWKKSIVIEENNNPLSP